MRKMSLYEFLEKTEIYKSMDFVLHWFELFTAGAEFFTGGAILEITAKDLGYEVEYEGEKYLLEGSAKIEYKETEGKVRTPIAEYSIYVPVRLVKKEVE